MMKVVLKKSLKDNKYKKYHECVFRFSVKKTYGLCLRAVGIRGIPDLKSKLLIIFILRKM